MSSKMSDTQSSSDYDSDSDTMKRKVKSSHSKKDKKRARKMHMDEIPKAKPSKQSNVVKTYTLPSMNDFPDASKSNYDLCDIQLVDDHAAVIEEHARQWRPLLTQIENMNLLDSIDDTVTLSMHLHNKVGNQTVANIITTFYQEKYADLIAEYPDLSEWILCVVHLLVNETFHKVRHSSAVQRQAPMVKMNIKRFGISKPKVSTSPNLETGPNYLRSLRVFKNIPQLLTIGRLVKDLAPSCLVAALMSTNKSPVTRIQKNEEKLSVNGFTINFSTNILWKITVGSGGKFKWFRLGRPEYLSKVLEEITGKSPLPSSFTMGSKRDNNDCFVANSDDGCKGKYSEDADIPMYGVFNRATCTGIGESGFGVKAFNDSSFVFDEKPQIAAKIQEDLSDIEKYVEENMDKIYGEIIAYYQTHGRQDLVDTVKKMQAQQSESME